jgi:hypothetical protein
MPTYSHNEGIVGNVTNSGTMAVGRGASATGNSPARADLAASAAQLREKYDLEKDRLPEAVRYPCDLAVEKIEEEVARDEPERGRLTAAMTYLKTTLTAATGVTTAVAALGKAIDGFFSPTS